MSSSVLLCCQILRSCHTSTSLPSCEEHHQVCQSLLFPSCCAKPSTQTLPNFDLITCVFMYSCIMPANFDPFQRLSWGFKYCVHFFALLLKRIVSDYRLTQGSWLTFPDVWFLLTANFCCVSKGLTRSKLCPSDKVLSQLQLLHA